MYTKKEKIELITLYINGHSIKAVGDLFAVKHPERRIPVIGSIYNIVKMFPSDGCVVNGYTKKPLQKK